MKRLILVLTFLVLLELALTQPRWGPNRRGRGGRVRGGRGPRGGWGPRGMMPHGMGGRHMMNHRPWNGLADFFSGQSPPRRHHGRYQWGMGPPSDPWLSFDFEFNPPPWYEKPWWTGPNVCFSETVAVENVTSEISSHMTYQSRVCDESDLTYRCTKTEANPDGKRTVTEVYECCLGYSREALDLGCPKEVVMQNLTTVLTSLELTEFTDLMNSSGLAKKIFRSSSNNFTIFAPSNDALQNYIGLELSGTDVMLAADPNVIMVSQDIQQSVVEDTRNVLLGHVAVGRYTSPHLVDDALIETASPFKSSIRINTYQSPVQLMTANCVKMIGIDHVASDGIVHVTDGVLEPVTNNLLELVSKNPELASLKTALGSSSLGAKLRDEKEHLTLFAPTDSAFRKHLKTFESTMANPKCLDNPMPLFSIPDVLKNHVLPHIIFSSVLSGEARSQNLLERYANLTYVLKNHLLPHIICSSVVTDEARSQNLLKRYANLTRDTANKLYVDGAQVVSPDTMATNGVLHIIDDVLLPDDALGMLELAAMQDLTEFTQLVSQAGMKKNLSNIDNVTLLVPSNKAIQNLSPATVQALQADPAYFKAVLQYHVVPGTHALSRVYNDLMLDTSMGDKLRLNEYSTFPFGRDWTRTVQCARFDSQPIVGCNGVMYVIDKVLLPPKGNVVDVLAQDPRFSTLVELFKSAMITDVLQENGPLTVFAPTNDAFKALGSDAVVELKENKSVLKATLLNHVTQDAVCCAGILRNNWLDTQKVRTLSGEVFEIGKSRRDVNYVGNADVTECDVAATNGVVHVVDRVIMKPKRQPDPFWDFFW